MQEVRVVRRRQTSGPMAQDGAAVAIAAAFVRGYDEPLGGAVCSAERYDWNLSAYFFIAGSPVIE